MTTGEEINDGGSATCQGTAGIPCRRTRDLHVDGHRFSSPAGSRSAQGPRRDERAAAPRHTGCPTPPSTSRGSRFRKG